MGSQRWHAICDKQQSGLLPDAPTQTSPTQVHSRDICMTLPKLHTWAHTLAMPWIGWSAPVSTRPRVTAGFSCPPDRWPAVRQQQSGRC